MYIYNNQTDFINSISARVLTAFVPSGQKMNYNQYEATLEQWKSQCDFSYKDNRIMFLEYMSLPILNSGIGVEFESKGIEAISLDSDLLMIPEATDALLPRSIFKHLFRYYFPKVEMNPLRLEYLYYRHVINFFGAESEISNMAGYLNNLDNFNIDYERALTDVRERFALANINLDNKTTSQSYRMTLAVDYLVSTYNVNNLLANNMVTMACGDYRAQRLQSFRVAKYGFFNGEEVTVNTIITGDYIEYLNKFKKANLNNTSTIGTSGLSRLV